MESVGVRVRKAVPKGAVGPLITSGPRAAPYYPEAALVKENGRHRVRFTPEIGQIEVGDLNVQPPTAEPGDADPGEDEARRMPITLYLAFVAVGLQLVVVAL